MSVNIKRNGTLQKLADQTLIFQANSAETRSGTITVPAISDINGNQSVQVVFSGPMPDTNYEVIIDEGADTWAHLTATVTNKTTIGFTLMVVTLVPNMPQLNFHYTAFKLVTLEGYSLVQSKINNPDSSPTQNSTNLVTSGGVYDAIKNASSVFIGTSSEWESESAKTDYQVAILTDKPNVNAVDSTTGDIEVVANKNLVFKGTLEEWEALTTAEKKTYDEALITNDMDTGEVVNAVTDGDMRAVTSNAVYDAINNIQTGTITSSVTGVTGKYAKTGHIVQGILYKNTAGVVAETDFTVKLPYKSTIEFDGLIFWATSIAGYFNVPVNSDTLRVMLNNNVAAFEMDFTYITSE